MPICHQCGNNDPRLQRAAQTCSYCYKSNAQLCPDCAWWEVDPIPAPAGAPFLTQKEQSERDALTQPCPARASRSSNRKRILKNRREDFLAELTEVCELLKQQSADAAFKAKALKACEIYDRVYHQDNLEDAAKTEEKKRQRMMHALIIIYLSAEKKSQGYKMDGPYADGAYSPKNPPNPPDPSTLLHRHDSPRFAQKHIEACFLGDEKLVPNNYHTLASAAIGLTVVERLLRRKISISGAHRTLLALRNDKNLNTDELREVLKLSTMLYHACTAASAPDVSPGNFDPRRAHGWFHPDRSKAPR